MLGREVLGQLLDCCMDPDTHDNPIRQNSVVFMQGWNLLLTIPCKLRLLWHHKYALASSVLVISLTRYATQQRLATVLAVSGTGFAAAPSVASVLLINTSY